MNKEFDEVLNGILEERKYIKIAKFIENNNFQLSTAQIEFVKFLYNNQDSVEIAINKSRQSGVTSILLSFILNQLLEYSNKYCVLLVGHKLLNTHSNFDKIKNLCIDNCAKYTYSNLGFMSINGNVILGNYKKLSNYKNKKIIVIYDEYAYIPIATINNIRNEVSKCNNVLSMYCSTPNSSSTNNFKGICSDMEPDKLFTVNYDNSLEL